MKAERWRQIEDLLDAALECEPAERGALLDRACAGDPDLRREVESLLVHKTPSENFIEAPAFVFAADLLAGSAGKQLEDQQLGPYKILRELGRGGMGAVYLAERSDGEFQQKVALKLVRRGFPDPDLTRRFRRERQILASLNHPNIARLLDGGVSDDGEPFFVMEYVEGVRIDAYCDEHNLSTEEKLKLFLTVCQGVAYAHQNLIVHRDIKPSNVLVTIDGTPKLLDFGIAKLLDAENADEYTESNFRAFTPDYAAPEQIRGETITTASDVYSLGVLLHDLLHDVRHSDNAQSAREARRSESSEQKTVATNLPTNQESGNRKAKANNQKFVGSELKNIIAMARREEPARRYNSVAQFAEDIQRYLAGLPVRAQKDSFTYRAEKFVRRNKVGVGAAALVLLSLVIGLAAALWQANVARRERDRAERRFSEVRQLSNALLTDIAPKIERLEGSTEARESLVKRAIEYLDSLARESADDPQLQSELAAAYEKVGDLQGAPRRPNLSDFSGAIVSYEKAQKIRQTLLAKNPSDFEQRRLLAANLSKLSYVRWWLSDVSASVRDSEKALEIYDRLIAERPDSVELKLAAAETQIDYANIYYFNDQIAETYPPLRKALTTLETLRQTNPESVETLRLLSRGYTNLGVTLRWDSKQKEGEAEMSKAFEISESLVEKYPHDTVLKQGLLYTYLQASQLYQEVDDARAFGILLKALRVAEDSVKIDLANTQARQNLAKTYSMLGLIALRLKKLTEAVSYLESSSATFAELEKIEPKNRTYKHDIGRVLMFLGLARQQRGNFTDALASYDKAVALFQDDVQADPKNIFPLRKLASVYTYIGDTHRDIAQAAGGGQERQTHRRAAKENYQRALDVFLQLQEHNALAEEDRKYLEETQAAVERMSEK
jgi:non-specific serine/threonine protein kinase/serine/threonine-protein kinase